MSATATSAGTFKTRGEIEVTRLGYGAMRVTGEGIWDPPKDHDAAIAVRRQPLAATQMNARASEIHCTAVSR